SDSKCILLSATAAELLAVFGQGLTRLISRFFHASGLSAGQRRMNNFGSVITPCAYQSKDKKSCVLKCTRDIDTKALSYSTQEHSEPQPLHSPVQNDVSSHSVRYSAFRTATDVSDIDILNTVEN
ncbi:hypothetical protein CYMTET_12983, partial [Cymbomonas tetramitiformis]